MSDPKIEWARDRASRAQVFAGVACGACAAVIGVIVILYVIGGSW